MGKHFTKFATITAIIFMCSASKSLHAQRLVFIYGHLQYQAPLAQGFKDNYNYGLGAEAGVGVGLFGKTFVTGTLGYSVFKASSINNSGNLKFAPVTVGLRHYVLLRILYLDANAGIGVLSASGIASTSRFTGNIGAGVKLGGFDVAIDYNGVSQPNGAGWGSWVAFKAGFNIGL